MKKFCIFTLLFFIALPVFNIFAACDELNNAMDAAAEAIEEARKNLKDLKDQRDMNFALRLGKTLDRIGTPKDFSDYADDMGDAANKASLDNQIRAAKTALNVT